MYRVWLGHQSSPTTNLPFFNFAEEPLHFSPNQVNRGIRTASRTILFHPAWPQTPK